jgi:DNA-binding transcriptional regulator GbsR (MarR family)
MKLSAAMERFILHWGEMGARWGVNRSVAQVHALLFLADQPMNAEDIQETLTMARSNVSTSLKELQAWKLVHLVHTLGDRRDHFVAEKDLWEMLRCIVEGRKQREVDPTLSSLRMCAIEAEGDGETPANARARIGELLAFMETLVRWYEEVKTVDPKTAQKLLSMGAAVVKFLPGGKGA